MVRSFKQGYERTQTKHLVEDLLSKALSLLKGHRRAFRRGQILDDLSDFSPHGVSIHLP